MAGQQPNTPARARLSRAIRTAWTLVLVMMLAAAAWSISGQLIRWGMDYRLAWALSLMFDLAGLICAEYARRAVERNTPAGLPRLAILGFVTVSGILNWTHGHQIGGYPAAAGLASISFAVELLFELHRRDVRDEQRHARGLVAERLPHIPTVAWIMYPGRSWATLRAAVGIRLDFIDPVQTGEPAHRPDTDRRASGTVRSAVRAAADTMPDADPDDIAENLTSLGIDVSAHDVRTILDPRPDATVRPIHKQAGPSIADSVRTAVASGTTELPGVLDYVRTVHGPDVNEQSVDRERRRTLAKRTG